MTLNRWQHSLLSLIILLGLILLITIACIRPAISYYQERQTELSSQQERLQKYRTMAAQKNKLIPLYKQQLSKTNKHQHFLPVMAPSLGAAKLQEQIKSLLEKHQGQLVSTQPVQAQPEGVFIPVMIRVHMKSDIETLLNVLHNLESSQPLAFIDNLQIQRVGSTRNNNRNKLKTRLNIKPLNTRFDLKVYMLNDKAES